MEGGDYEKIMDELIIETGLEMTLEFHYKFLVYLRSYIARLQVAAYSSIMKFGSLPNILSKL
jgi:hypothetical protein